MARKLPTIADDKFTFFKSKLLREVSNLFIWNGLPDEIPKDYLERSLIQHGRVMFFPDNDLGYMAIVCTAQGYNVYGKPVTAVATTPNTDGQQTYHKRTILHEYSDLIELSQSCVLIDNMYDGESLQHTLDHYAQRLALIQQAFDTNALWQNMPPLYSVPDSTTKLSIEKLFSDIMSGQPWVVVDDQLKAIGTQSVVGTLIEMPFLLDKLHDSMNEVYSAFKSTVGIDTAGADKKERLIVDEVNSNNQSTQTCLDVMLSQRKKACELINRVYGLNVFVDVNKQEMEDLSDGNRNSGTQTPVVD